MKIVLVGTSNSIMGEYGFVKALREEHVVVNLSLGRSPFYMHFAHILDNLNLIQDSDCLIIEHLNNDGYSLSWEYYAHLQDFYDLLASINTNIIVLCFPCIINDSNKSFKKYRFVSESLASKRNITFINIKSEYFTEHNFYDFAHIERYPSYLLGEWLLDVLDQDVFFRKPKKGFFSGYSVLKPVPTNTFSNSFLSVKYCEISYDEVVIEQNSKNISILSIEYKSNGFCRFGINGNYFHVIAEDIPVICEPFGFEFKISGNFRIKKSRYI